MTASIIAFGIGAALGGVVFWIGHKVGFDKGQADGYRKARKEAWRSNGMSDIAALAMATNLFGMNNNMSGFPPQPPASKTDKK